MRKHFALGALALSLVITGTTQSAEILTLDKDNWHLVPGGKEVDAIYGDYLLKNDKVVAVVASAIPNRQLNLRVRDAQGVVADFALLGSKNDQLTAFQPHAFVGGGPAADRIEVVRDRGEEVLLRVTRKATAKDPVETVTDYSLKDGDTHLTVVTTRTNTGDKPAAVRLTDRLLHETPARQMPPGQHDVAFYFDRYFGMAYGVGRPAGKVAVPPSSPAAKNTFGFIDYPDLATGKGPGAARIEPGGKIVVKRYLIAGEDAARVQHAAAALAGRKPTGQKLVVNDETGKPLPRAEVTAYDAEAYEKAAPEARRNLPAASFAFTDDNGEADLPLPPGEYAIVLEQPGRRPVTVNRSVSAEAGGDEPVLPGGLAMGPASKVVFDVVDETGEPSPVKVQFVGVGNTPNPYLGPDQRADGCRNLWFSVKGRFEVPLPPGEYYIILSRGPEHDAAWRTVQLGEGKAAKVSARLPRVVDSKGWVSADFHNHTTLSGDNSTEVEGRIAALVAEGVEFGAATEHQRVTSYKPYLKAMGVEKLMATSDGMELTGQPLLLNHQNAFPLHAHPHTQFGGGPEIHPDPLVQIKRLRDHDNGADKLMQQNHPDIGWLVYDRDGDGKPDAGHGTLPYTDVIEIWTTTILDQKPTLNRGGNQINDRMFNWLQLLNQGHRLPGVANTDAHHCFHDSGTIRNWVKSGTDDPAAVKETDVVRESRQGRLVMSSGPFLEVSLNDALPGDDLKLSGEGKLKVRVQCPNWFDVNRVQVLVNGKPDPALNFTRKSHPQMFADGVVKFEQAIPLKLSGDAHVIVVATEEGGTTAPVMGPRAEPPMAISNPIYVDTDGNGFKASGDTLGAPLPVKK